MNASSSACFVSLGGEMFALEGSHVSQIVEVGDLTPVPRSSKDLLGVFAARNLIVPLLDARGLLELPTDTTRADLAALLDFRGEQLGLRVDGVHGFVPELQEVQADPASPFAPQQCRYGDNNARILDLSTLLSVLTERVGLS